MIQAPVGTHWSSSYMARNAYARNNTSAARAQPVDLVKSLRNLLVQNQVIVISVLFTLQRNLSMPAVRGAAQNQDLKSLVILHGLSMFTVKAKIIECYIIKPAQSLLMKHLVIGQR